LSDTRPRLGATLTPSLRVRPSQKLSLTPSLRQSIIVLAMSAAELADLIAAEVDQNPALTATPRLQDIGGPDFEAAMETVAAPVTLGEHLRRQLSYLRLDPDVRGAAFILTESLSAEGYLSDPPEDIAARFDLDSAILEQALHALWSCDPPGIGARDLAHCLFLQLIAAGETPDTARFATENLLAITRRAAGLAAQPSEVERLSRLIQALDPTPGTTFEARLAPRRYPEFEVTRRPDGRLVAVMDDAFLPELHLDPAIAGAGRQDAALGAATARARALIRAIDGRKRTILKIAEAILADQAAFFDHGLMALRPVTQADLADRLGLHPSTITRAIAGKSLSCASGIYPLSFFFSRAIPGQDGHDLAPAAIRSQIARLVRAEPADAILSDRQIAAALSQTGVDIARRTVAKYRKCLNIPPASERRRSKRLL
jgi:RNA polymerase sigma-54 factor